MSELPSPGTIFARAWRSARAHAGPLLFTWVVFTVVTVALRYFVAKFARQLGGDQFAAWAGTNLADGLIGLLGVWVFLGLTRMHLEAARGQRPALGTLFGGGALFATYLLTASLVQAALALVFFPASWIASEAALQLARFNPVSELAYGAGFLLVTVIAIFPLLVAASNALFFALDAEQDPLAALTSGLHSVRGRVGWTLRLGGLALSLVLLGLVGLGLGLWGWTKVGAAPGLLALLLLASSLLIATFALLCSAHAYLALSQVLEAQLQGDDAASDVEAVASDRFGPLTPKSAPTEIRARRPRLELPRGARYFPRRTVAPATIPLALVLLLPWVVAGGNPLTAGIAGYELAGRLGLDSALGASTAVGGLILSGLAALLLLALSFRGRRALVLDAEGFALDVTPHWQGVRVRWAEIAGFRITGRGVQLRLRHRLWRWLWRPVVPVQGRPAHDVVEVLEAQQVFAVD